MTNTNNEMNEYTYDELLHETADAWLLKIGDDQAWFPKSKCNIFENTNG